MNHDSKESWSNSDRFALIENERSPANKAEGYRVRSVCVCVCVKEGDRETKEEEESLKGGGGNQNQQNIDSRSDSLSLRSFNHTPTDRPRTVIMISI